MSLDATTLNIVGKGLLANPERIDNADNNPQTPAGDCHLARGHRAAHGPHTWPHVDVRTHLWAGTW